jgi:hypothetical protein
MEDFSAPGGFIPPCTEAENSISLDARSAAEFLIEILAAKEGHE